MVKRRVGWRKRKLKDLIEYSVLVGFCALFLFTALHFVLNPTPVHVPENTRLKAALVDQLSITQPNQTFTERATGVLEKAGFSVDVYDWTSITVDFYGDLPSKDYKLIIFRTHSGILMNASGHPIPGNPVFLFTAEEYDPNRHTLLLLTDQVVPANPWDIEKFYFAISPKFVRETMNGRFQDTVIIIAGCHGLYSTTLAEALIERGASVVISWDKGVMAPYMDKATIFLLNKLLIENKTVEQAVGETMETIGPDPDEGAILRYYPTEKVRPYLFGPHHASHSQIPEGRTPRPFQKATSPFIDWLVLSPSHRSIYLVCSFLFWRVCLIFWRIASSTDAYWFFRCGSRLGFSGNALGVCLRSSTLSYFSLVLDYPP